MNLFSTTVSPVYLRTCIIAGDLLQHRAGQQMIEEGVRRGGGKCARWKGERSRLRAIARCLFESWYPCRHLDQSCRVYSSYGHWKVGPPPPPRSSTAAPPFLTVRWLSKLVTGLKVILNLNQEKKVPRHGCVLQSTAVFGRILLILLHKMSAVWISKSGGSERLL